MELEIKQIQYLIKRAQYLQNQIKIMISLITKVKNFKSAYEGLCNSILKSAEKRVIFNHRTVVNLCLIICVQMGLMINIRV